ncbi:MAG: YtxH domain-containing protein [Pseudomonadota bacterium]|nr:YtxH domain-containing protein [Pseudomonadota bacterium]
MTLEKMKSLDKDDFLNMLGLESKRNPVDYMVPALALFGVGVLVGTGIGLLVAPRPGRELRADIVQRLEHAPEAMARLPQRANDAMHRVSDQISEKLHDGKVA